MPVFTVSVRTWLQAGFSTKLRTFPSSPVRTWPYSRGELWRQSTRVAAARLARWKPAASVRSMSVMMSPLMTRKSSSPSQDMHRFTLPAVPRGSRSTK